MSTIPKTGTIGWVDLTVPDAVAARDFYSAVAGWAPSPVPMGGYGRYCVIQDPAGAVAALFAPADASQG
jgi:predicted enzyme related to lactoylglutathione lyase